MTDAQLLQRCRELIAQKLSWPPSGEWRNYEFTELSEKILEATGVGLSTTTLKRVFGKVQYNNMPSSYTLNTLAQYVGYENWMQLKAREDGPPTPFQAVLPQDNRNRVNVKGFFVGVVLLGLIVMGGFIFFSAKPKRQFDPSAIAFSSRPIAQGLPNSVVFNLDLKGVKSDKLWIQQYWDSTKTVPLSPGQTEATGIYYRPGYYRARLMVDGEVVKEHDLFIKSEQWMATIDHEPVPAYLSSSELIISDSTMEVAPVITDVIKKFGTPLTMTYHLVKPFDGLRSDNFTLQASIKNTLSDGPAVCRSARIFILCKDGAFIIPFSIPGCVSDINLKLGEKFLVGKSNDLSAFGIDLKDWTDVKVSVKDNKVQIFAAGKMIWEEVMASYAGEVVGLRFSFLGAGSVRGVRLGKDDQSARAL